MLIKVLLYRGVRAISKLKRKCELCCGTSNLYALFRIIDPTCLIKGAFFQTANIKIH